MDTQGEKKYLWSYFMTISFMLEKVDDFRVEFNDEASKGPAFKDLSDCCAHSWNKVEKYYNLCDKAPIIYAAMALNPAKKMQWFRAKWENGTPEQRRWLPLVKASIEELWRSEYKSTTVPEEPQNNDDDSDDLFIQLHNYKRLKLSAAAAPVDPLSAYLDTDTEPETKQFDPLQYWYQRRHDQPDLARFAFDALAIPLMSDDPERSFSAARDMITYRRNQLTDDIIQACACLRSWYGPPKKEKKVFDSEEVIERAYGQAQGVTFDEDSIDGNNTWDLTPLQRPS